MGKKYNFLKLFACLALLWRFFFSFCRANLDYELSLFVVKNLCYIFMLIHSLYPGIISVYSKLNCRENEDKGIVEENSGSSSAQPLDNSKFKNSNDCIEMNLMKSPTPSQPRNLNRVSIQAPAESGDDASP